MSWTVLFILSVIEGLTEFLPISSTGHLMLFSSVVGLNHDEFVKSFNIIIQFGAILSVLTLYWRKFLEGREFYFRLLLAFVPAALLGFLFKAHFEALLSNPTVICWALIIGGLVLVVTDRAQPESVQSAVSSEPAKLNRRKAFTIGWIQCLALIPGVSRSGATILGGLWLKLGRKEAAEFSFFLAVPTLAAASLYKLRHVSSSISSDQAVMLAAGFFLSYIFAMLALVFMMKIVVKYGFKHFGFYRIALGCLGLFAIYKEWIS
jgi:undecaprenyl-diphosphatase